MNAPMSSWRLIRAGVGREVVVTADFAATGRPEAGFADLAPHLRTDHPIWEISPPWLDTPATWSGAAMVRQWVSELDEAGMHVSAVLGFCASSSFALAIARVVGSGQPYAPQVWYYCSDPAGYYPDVAQCNVQWVTVGMNGPAG